MKFIIEGLLVEKIADVKKYYPNIDDETFDKIIRLDPTFTNNDSLGTYGKWLLNNYKKSPNNFKWDTATNLLQEFESKRTALDNKDINKYKSFDDLKNTLDNTETPEQTKSKKKREISKSNIEDGATKVYEDDEWVVYIPNTYEASCKLGRNTKWCTATTEQRYRYDDYTKQGPLYIVINKHNPDEKYQFHFERGEFNSTDNSAIDVHSFLVNNPALYNGAFKGLSEKVDDTVEWFLKNNGTYVYGIDEKRDKYVLPKIRDLLKHLIIDKSVTIIPVVAFTKFTNLEVVEIDEGVESIGLGAFLGCKNLVSVKLPSSLKIIGVRAFDSCYKLKHIELPDGLEKLEYMAFFECRSLTKINIPTNITHISDDTFERCYKLESIKLHDNVKIIDICALRYCENLKHIELPQSLTAINRYALYGCTSLTSIVIPKNVSHIGENVFGFCSQLEKIFIPKSVTEIGNFVFSECDNLTVYCEALSKPEGWGNYWADDFKGKVIWGAKRPINECLTMRFKKL